MSVIIKSIDRGSPAQKAGIKAGERLISINGSEIVDVLDFRYYETEKITELLLEAADGSQRTVIIKKGEYQPIGLEFETYLMDKQRSCKNKCIFCFVDQMPKGMRETLYFKDDDERLSFLFGNYITLTNLSERELDRIIKMKITPINVSVHTTDPDLRVDMMKNPAAAQIMTRLKKLAEGGIQLNCQLVLCPGINDGEALRRSLDELCSLAPQVQSIALVPVGLTKHREGLYPLRLFTPLEAHDVIAMAMEYSQRSVQNGGSRLVWAADEFYITAGIELPKPHEYEDYPQLENGVGLVSLLEEEFMDAVEYAEGDDKEHFATIATGVSAAPYIERLVNKAKEKWRNAKWNVVPIINRFFGESITVAGLVTGSDIAEQLSDKQINGSRLLIPAVMLRHGGDVFLDDMTPAQIEEKLGVTLTAVPNDGQALLDALLGD